MPEKEERGMLSVKENFFETVKPDGHPDRLMKQYEGLAFLNMNPVLKYIRGDRHPGMPPTKDQQGNSGHHRMEGLSENSGYCKRMLRSGSVGAIYQTGGRVQSGGQDSDGISSDRPV